MSDIYKQIVIFAGTTEGRELSARLSAAGICHTVCVATDYGKLMQPEDEFAKVHEGRLDASAMREFFETSTIVVDATHPFAFEVTDNLKKAAAERALRYIRVLRAVYTLPKTEGNIRFFDSMESCAEAINSVQGNVLLTTGSKELAAICSIVKDCSRLYARVLPSVESITLCERAGIRNNHIIALHGPFTEDTNAALLSQYGIRYLVTRDSGKNGGYDEKLSAAKRVGAECFVIRRPAESDGISPEAAFEQIRELSSGGAAREGKKLAVDIIGAGMGAESGFTLAASEALKKADAVFGAGRLIESVRHYKKHDCYLAKDIIPLVEDELQKKSSLRAAVLFSGDISFFSGAVKFESALRAWAETQDGLVMEVCRYPGISSVSYMAAKLGVSSSDAVLLSLHGRNSAESIYAAAAKLAATGAAFVLLSSGDDLAALASALQSLNVSAEFAVGSRLSYADETVTELSMTEALHFAGKGLYTLYVRKNNYG